jgi:hypothetical protein
MQLAMVHNQNMMRVLYVCLGLAHFESRTFLRLWWFRSAPTASDATNFCFSFLSAMPNLTQPNDLISYACAEVRKSRAIPVKMSGAAAYESLQHGRTVTVSN